MMTMRSLWLIAVALLMHCQQCNAQQITAPGASRAEVVRQLTPEIGGIKQFVDIRTDDPNKPVLLFFSGGPGSSMVKNSDNFTSLLKSRFTIVHWDQRNAGKTLELNASPNRPSLEQMERDALEVLQFVIKETGHGKVYLLGSSWGNVLGFSIVETHPELLNAYFAVNPVVSQLASEKELLVILKNHFQGNPDASKELSSVVIPFEKDEDLFYLRKWLFYKDGKTNVTSSDFKNGFLQWSASWLPVSNQVMAIDLRATLKKVAVPVYFFVGKNDIQTSTGITISYFGELTAPRKKLFLFEHSGHQIHRDEPEKFQKTIIRILDEIRLD